jgi:pseudouridine-5'-phosphate glycosidase
VAILGGVPHVGLTKEQLEHVAKLGPEVSWCKEHVSPVCVAWTNMARAVADDRLTTSQSANVACLLERVTSQATVQPCACTTYPPASMFTADDRCMFQVRKTSRRDLPVVIARQLDGATTVSATMLLAHRAGIDIFVTGGARQQCRKHSRQLMVKHSNTLFVC